MREVIKSAELPKTYCFIDLETCNTALHHSWDLPWQISTIKLEGKKIVEEKDFYIKWPQGIVVSDGAAQKTGYDPLVIEKLGKPPDEVFDSIQKDLLESDFVVGHNIIGLDIYVWRTMGQFLRKDACNFIPKAIDTAALSKAFKIGAQPLSGENFIAWQYKMYHTRKKGVKFSLETMGKEFGIEHDYSKLHNALYDLRLNVKVFQSLQYHFGV